MSRRVWADIAVLVFAGLVRLPHYDIAWFGNDQIAFVAEARRILAGDWNVTGPRAAGLNIIGPLYSYALAGLLWVGKDVAFLALFNAVCEVIAAWLVYDAGRRLSGQAAGIAAGVIYASAPMLAISTRLIWNPSLLPAAVALGCWLVVRYCERPSTGRLLAVAFVSGLTLTLHATGIFPSAAWVLVALLVKRPSLVQLIAAAIVGGLPLTPLWLRLLGGASPASTGALPLGVNDVLDTIAGITKLTLRFPIGADAEHWSSRPSSFVLYFDALLAVIGLAIGVTRRDRYRPVWLGLATALGLYLIGAIVYAGPLAFYYFTGPVAIVCLCAAHCVGAWPRLRVAATTLIVCLSIVHVVFLYQFDRRAIDQGFMKAEGDGLVTRMPPAVGYYLSVRDLESIANGLRGTFSDGETAMRASHGFRAEIWREANAEGLPRVLASRAAWTSEFVIMQPGPTILHPNARLAGDRVCVFDRPADAVWKVWPGEVPEGWQLPTFADDRWYVLDMPRRMMGDVVAAPSAPTLWRVPRQSFRGRINVTAPAGQHLYVVSAHSAGNSQHWITRFAVNGADLPIVKNRLAPTSLYRNEEWLFDATGLLKEGENLIAFGLDGQQPAFDVDIFELPCLDDEWYNANR